MKNVKQNYTSVYPSLLLETLCILCAEWIWMIWKLARDSRFHWGGVVIYSPCSDAGRGHLKSPFLTIPGYAQGRWVSLAPSLSSSEATPDQAELAGLQPGERPSTVRTSMQAAGREPNSIQLSRSPSYCVSQLLPEYSSSSGSFVYTSWASWNCMQAAYVGKWMCSSCINTAAHLSMTGMQGLVQGPERSECAFGPRAHPHTPVKQKVIQLEVNGKWGEFPFDSCHNLVSMLEDSPHILSWWLL